MPLIDVKKTERLQHPDEPDVWFDIRKLRGTEMDEAREVHSKHIMELFGSALEAMAKLTSTADKSDSPATRAQSYDTSTLLRYAVVGWSYDAEVNVADLDFETRDWLKVEVVARNTRPLAKSSV